MDHTYKKNQWFGKMVHLITMNNIYIYDIYNIICICIYIYLYMCIYMNMTVGYGSKLFYFFVLGLWGHIIVKIWL